MRATFYTWTAQKAKDAGHFLHVDRSKTDIFARFSQNPGLVDR
jgi:hypothetical protein